jgi:micrococcal nuclease
MFLSTAFACLTMTLTGCVKAQGPVVQGAPSQSSGNPSASSSPGSGGSGVNPPTGAPDPACRSGLSTVCPGDEVGPAAFDAGAANSGAEPQAGAVVVEAIRKGPLQPNGTVTHLVDGDTVDVAFTTGNGKSNTERIRLIGIDTPETKRPNTPVECFGREASSALAALIPIGTKVLIERDLEERDRYGRLLGYVFRSSDGLFVNHEMVRAGMATPYTFPPNIAYVDVFAAAGDASRAAAAGLWSRCESGHTPL